MSAKLKTFQFIYQVDAENLKKAICVMREIEENTGMQPKQIINCDGRVLTYNDYVVHKFIDHGEIDEEKFVDILSIPERPDVPVSEPQKTTYK